MFSREQVFIDPHFAGVLKAWQKDTFFHAGERQLPLHELIRFSKEWFDMRAAELAERRAREEAWREMWTGRKGEILRLFAAIDADADGEIDLSELEGALDEHLGSFFGFTQDTGVDGMEGWLRAEIEAGHLSAAALFKRLDKDNSGTVSFDEFYDVLNDWFDSGFNAVEELREKEMARRKEAERIAAERKVHEERERALAEARAAEEARLAEEERKRAEDARHAEALRHEAARKAEYELEKKRELGRGSASGPEREPRGLGLRLRLVAMIPATPPPHGRSARVASARAA